MKASGSSAASSDVLVSVSRIFATTLATACGLTSLAGRARSPLEKTSMYAAPSVRYVSAILAAEPAAPVPAAASARLRFVPALLACAAAAMVAASARLSTGCATPLFFGFSAESAQWLAASLKAVLWSIVALAALTRASSAFMNRLYGVAPRLPPVEGGAAAAGAAGAAAAAAAAAASFSAFLRALRSSLDSAAPVGAATATGVATGAAAAAPLAVASAAFFAAFSALAWRTSAAVGSRPSFLASFSLVPIAHVDACETNAQAG